MPMYDYFCPNCNNTNTKFFSFENFKEKIKCNKCGKMMKVSIKNNIKTQAHILPPHMRTTRGGTAGDNDFKYGKSPSKKKHYF